MLQSRRTQSLFLQGAADLVVIVLVYNSIETTRALRRHLLSLQERIEGFLEEGIG